MPDRLTESQHRLRSSGRRRGRLERGTRPGSGPRVLVRWGSAPADRDTPGRIMVAIVGPGVAAVRAAGYGTFNARHVGGLPAGYKAVVFYYPKWPADANAPPTTQPGIERVIRRLEQLPSLVPLTPLNSAGKATAAAATNY